MENLDTIVILSWILTSHVISHGKNVLHVQYEEDDISLDRSYD